MPEEKKNKGGRPPRVPGHPGTHSLAFRVRGPMRDRLQAAAQASGRSLSEEIERRLDRTLDQEDFAGSELNARLVQGISSVIALVEERSGETWFKSKETREAIRDAINAYLDAALEPRTAGLLGPSPGYTEHWISKFIRDVAAVVDAYKPSTSLFPRPKVNDEKALRAEGGDGLLDLIGDLRNLGRFDTSEPKHESDPKPETDDEQTR